ncbi:MAG: glycosyltransferase family 2 protein [Thermoleophilia bacterium]
MSALAADAVAALVTCHREPPAQALLARLLLELPRVLVVDDAMPPGRALGLDELACDLGVEVLRLARRSGKGHAIAAGVCRLREGAAPPAGVLVLDGDGQHPPERIPDFLAASAVAELVIGNRFETPRDVPFVRRVSNRVASHVVARTTGAPVHDSQCGMRLLCGRALAEVRFPGGGFDSETHHLKHCLHAGVRVGWVPIPAIYEGRPSSFRPLRDSVAVLRAALADGATCISRDRRDDGVRSGGRARGQ